jgi:VWFA-related protein
MRRGCRRASLVLGILLLVVRGGARGQAAPAPPPVSAASADFGERIDVRAVNVEVVVTDAQGKRVRGLGAEDFRLLVDGREERIDYYAEVADGETAPAPAGPAALSAASAPATALAPPPGLAGGGRVGTSYLVFLDDAFAVASQRNAALSTLERDLSLLGPADRMAIVAFDGKGLIVLSRWTGDVAVLEKALAQAAKRKTHGSRIVANRRGDQRATAIDMQDLYDDADLLGVVPTLDVSEIWQNASGVGKAASAAAATLRGLPLPEGRRVMMVLAGGWPWDGDPRALLPLTATANRLGYTLYPVHVAGFDPLVEAANAEVASVGISADSRQQSGGGPIVNGWERVSEAALKNLAKATGGVAALNRDHALRQVVEDTRSYYWLGFSPIWRADDRPHSITVTVRRSGLSVRNRKSFFDLAPGTAAGLTAESLLLLGGDPTRKRLQVTAEAKRSIDRKVFELPLTLMIPSEVLTPLPDPAGSHVVQGWLSFASLDEKGGRARLPSQSLRAELPEAPRPGGFVRFHATLRLRRAAQRLVVSVQDPTSGAMLWGDLEVKP